MPAPIRARAARLQMGFGLEDPDDSLYGSGTQFPTLLEVCIAMSPGFQDTPGPVGGRVWLALHGPLLFLSAGPEPWAPLLGKFPLGDVGSLKCAV